MRSWVLILNESDTAESSVVQYPVTCACGPWFESLNTVFCTCPLWMERLEGPNDDDG